MSGAWLNVAYFNLAHKNETMRALTMSRCLKIIYNIQRESLSAIYNTFEAHLS